MKPLRQTLLFAGLVSAAALASADTMTCGSWVITPETTVAELLKKCGQPTSRQSTTEDVRTKGRTGSIKVGETTTEQWIYKRSSAAYPMVVTIVDGAVTSIAAQR